MVLPAFLLVRLFFCDHDHICFIPAAMNKPISHDRVFRLIDNDKGTGLAVSFNAVVSAVKGYFGIYITLEHEIWYSLHDRIRQPLGIRPWRI